MRRRRGLDVGNDEVLESAARMMIDDEESSVSAAEEENVWVVPERMRTGDAIADGVDIGDENESPLAERAQGETPRGAIRPRGPASAPRRSAQWTRIDGSTTTTTTFSASMPAFTHRVPDRSLTHSVSPPSRDARTSIGTAAAFAPWPMRPANGVCSCPPRMTAISGTCQKTKHDVISRIARVVRK